jgi:hypothetical protein
MNNIQSSEQIAVIPLSAPVLAPMFTTLPFRCPPSSQPPFHIHRDGTDPLLGGHRASHRHRPAGGMA